MRPSKASSQTVAHGAARPEDTHQGQSPARSRRHIGLQRCRAWRDAGEAYLHVIGAALDRLREYPEMGMARFDLGELICSLPVGEHRIYYRFNGAVVSVARVLHKAMDPARHL